MVLYRLAKAALLP